MGECGCTSQDERYWFPAPGRKLYLLTIHGGCRYCGSPAGVCVERIDRLHASLRDYKADYTDGELLFVDWGDSVGAAVVTSHEKREFIKAMLPHLVGVRSADFGNNGAFDEDGADVLLADAYSDAVYRPRLVKPVETLAPLDPTG